MTYYCVGCGVTFLGCARDFTHCRGREIGDYDRQLAEDKRREEEMVRRPSTSAYPTTKYSAARGRTVSNKE